MTLHAIEFVYIIIYFLNKHNEIKLWKLIIEFVSSRYVQIIIEKTEHYANRKIKFGKVST